MSWKTEVAVDSSGKWLRNGLRFATRDEAECNVQSLRQRWKLVRDTRVVECDDPVSHRWVAGRTVNIKEDQP